MTNESSVTSTVPVNNPNATTITAPINDDFLGTTVEPTEELGSHRVEEKSAAAPSDNADADSETVDEAVPARLKGKNLAQVYDEFRGLEEAYGRQGNELGQARELLRDTLKQVLDNASGAATAAAREADVTDEDLQSNPGEAVRKLIKKEMEPVVAATATADQKLAAIEFNGRHPGYQQTASSPEFKEWVAASPYRTKLFANAARYNMDAAEELFGAWEERPAATAGAADESAAQRRTEIRKVKTVTGGAGKTADAKGGKKIYKSTELAKLYITDRDRYNDMQPEILAAYAEGRVK